MLAILAGHDFLSRTSMFSLKSKSELQGSCFEHKDFQTAKMNKFGDKPGIRIPNNPRAPLSAFNTGGVDETLNGRTTGQTPRVRQVDVADLPHLGLYAGDLGGESHSLG